MSLKILLVRHATHDDVEHILSGRSHIALNERGRREAQKLAGGLRERTIDEVHSSPRRRARETASILATGLAIEPRVVDALDEIDFGDWTGCGFVNLATDARWRVWNDERDRAVTPGGETMASATSRTLRHLEALPENGCILCVTHADIIRGVVVHYLGWTFDRLLSIDVHPASVTTLKRTHESTCVARINERLS